MTDGRIEGLWLIWFSGVAIVGSVFPVIAVFQRDAWIIGSAALGLGVGFISGWVLLFLYAMLVAFVPILPDLPGLLSSKFGTEWYAAFISPIHGLAIVGAIAGGWIALN